MKLFRRGPRNVTCNPSHPPDGFPTQNARAKQSSARFNGQPILFIASGTFLALSAASVVWEWLAAAATEQFFRSHSYPSTPPPIQPSTEILPPASILIPLKGASPVNGPSLRSMLAQDYLDFDVIVGMEEEDTDAATFVNALQKEPFGERLRLAQGSNSRGGRSQVSNIHHAMAVSKADVFVIVDADIVAGPGFLLRMVHPLLASGTGAATCFYRQGGGGSLWNVVDGLWTSTSFLPSAIFGRRVIGQAFTFGAARSIRRDVLESAGGFGSIDPAGMDDYQLGQLAVAAGFSVEFVPYVVTELMPRLHFLQLVNRRTRWFRNIRILQPAGYAGSIITYGVGLALLSALCRPKEPGRWQWLGVVTANRLVCAALVRRHLDPGASMIDVGLTPVRDLLALAVWALGFTAAKDPRFRLRRK
ncbi:MAG: glycosyltransferase [Armatimonadota bacterium]|nr:glycosyltransferase [Armatimonadota bacterium]